MNGKFDSATAVMYSPVGSVRGEYEWVKRYEELTITDDFIFGKAMGDKVLCYDINNIRDA